ncbi:UNVERIFIED_CONTAM: hypothetical protein Sradi_0111900 [Sesamum radiatum]|uniref:Uncharacterized protein n=1 Tax=Sesamum radiatum TaxID=300843 RepID=A0AAW2WIS4_SESRA
MAATAYAAVVSLSRVLEDILHHAPKRILLDHNTSNPSFKRLLLFNTFLKITMPSR